MQGGGGGDDDGRRTDRPTENKGLRALYNQRCMRINVSEGGSVVKTGAALSLGSWDAVKNHEVATADGEGEPVDCKKWGTLIPGELGCCEKP